MTSPEAPERRRHEAGHRHLDRLRPGERTREVVRRTLLGVWNDGFVHAGNLAYLALTTLFPFFIVAAALARLFGRGGDGLRAADQFLGTMPPGVRDVLRQPIVDVLAARSGSLLWLGALVGLWTTASFIETLRDILRRAYGTSASRPFWEYRLAAAGLIIGAVVLTFVAFSLQVVLIAAEQFLWRLVPFATGLQQWISISKIAPALGLFGALYMLFYALTPSRYRYTSCPKWPGALFTASWWVAVTQALPAVLALLGGYSLTYGSLAGVMITLIFFYLVGLGVVVGAQLNAALAEVPLEPAGNMGQPGGQEEETGP